MIQGTMSGAGKSLLVAGLCRIFRQDGYRVAPFKSQNMALNSYITKEGLEMGRAQVMQAEAAGIEPLVCMNPILLKPTSHTGSQVIVNGEVRGNLSARDYFAHKTELIPEIKAAFRKLETYADIIVIEGAGSPAEINLKTEDIVNMGMAKMAKAPVLLVGDIDRGGVFAQLIGTVELLEEDEREMVKGLIINKFRGDKTILDPGVQMLEERSHIPVVGVAPYLDIQVEDEDSLTERFDRKQEVDLIDIAVIRVPRISNFTDFNALEVIPGVSVRYVKHPAELKFVLVDPKKVEFSIYSVIENHFLAKLPDGGEPIITDVTKVVQTLNSVCVEMDTRYDLLKMAHVRNIKEYNEKFINRRLNPEKGHKFMPYIVVVIDEFGDLIMTAGKEVELPIARIAQLARAVGIHMIIATQRPTTNIITGTIKANFPARIAFRVSAMMDSRTILDRPGANRLIGKGDMLFLQGADPVRVQCAFIDTPEVEEITKFIARQQSYPTPFFLPEFVSEDGGSEVGDIDMGRLDPLFEDAARLVVIHQQGSTSLIQRKFAIGYNRAGRIMDQLEKAGIVGPTQGSKARDVLCMDDNDLEMRLNNLQ